MVVNYILYEQKKKALQLMHRNNPLIVLYFIKFPFLLAFGLCV